MWKFTYMEKGLPFLLSKITEFISTEDKLYCYKEKLKLLVYIQTLYNCIEKTDKLTKKEIAFSWTIPANCENRKLKDSDVSKIQPKDILILKTWQNENS